MQSCEMSFGKEQNSNHLRILTEAVQTVLTWKLRSKDSEFSQYEKIFCAVPTSAVSEQGFY